MRYVQLGVWILFHMSVFADSFVDLRQTGITTLRLVPGQAEQAMFTSPESYHCYTYTVRIHNGFSMSLTKISENQVFNIIGIDKGCYLIRLEAQSDTDRDQQYAMELYISAEQIRIPTINIAVSCHSTVLPEHIVEANEAKDVPVGQSIESLEDALKSLLNELNRQ